jgi:hypothetical protein
MRRCLLTGGGLLALVVLLGWASSAHARLTAPATHGGDPVSLDLRREIAGPRGGPFGRPLGAAGEEKSLSAAVRGALPEAWCGEQRSTDDTAHELANGDYKYHAIYAFPSDGVDRFRAVASTHGDQRGDACEADPRAKAATTPRRIPNDRIRISLHARTAAPAARLRRPTTRRSRPRSNRPPLRAAGALDARVVQRQGRKGLSRL